jgi:hypothetical protein
MIRMNFAPAAAIAFAMSTLAAPASAAAERFEANYSVSLFGLPIARATFQSAFEGDNFRIDGSLSSAGIARIFDSTTGTTRVEGSLGREGVSPTSYRVDYTTGDKQKRTAISFSNGNVTSTENHPKPTRRPSTWVAVSPEHLRSVVDPITSTLVRADAPGEVCNRTIKVFDGEMRADLRLSHVSTGPVRGFEGEAVTCSARFVPVAGYRAGRSQIEFLRDRSRISISFMPLGTTGVYTPVEASIGTQIGTVQVRAQNIVAR